MKRGERVSNNTVRKKRVTQFWLDVATEYTTPPQFAPKEIANKHINPLTGKPYTTRHIYFILRQMKVI